MLLPPEKIRERLVNRTKRKAVQLVNYVKQKRIRPGEALHEIRRMQKEDGCPENDAIYEEAIRRIEELTK